MRVFFLFSIFLFASCEQAPEKKETMRPARALQLEDQSTLESRTFPGRTRAVHRVNLSFRVDGPMIKRPVFVGDRVKKNELLAEIDPRDYEVKVQNAKGRLERFSAELRFAKRDYERAQNIYKEDPGAISQSYLDKKKEDVNRLKGEVRSTKAELAAAKDQLSYTHLRSPYDGIIVATFVQPFEYVREKQPILRLLDTGEVEMVIHVPENMISHVDFVDKIFVTIDALGSKEFPATVKEVGTEASATTRTFPVTLLIKQPEEGMILAGMAGYARIYGKDVPELSEEGFILPTSAVFSGVDKDKSFVFVIDPHSNHIHAQEVTLGRLTSQGIFVTKGLSTGDWVVTSGVNGLHEGDKVRILPVTLNAKGEQVEL